MFSCKTVADSLLEKKAQSQEKKKKGIEMIASSDTPTRNQLWQTAKKKMASFSRMFKRRAALRRYNIIDSKYDSSEWSRDRRDIIKYVYINEDNLGFLSEGSAEGRRNEWAELLAH